MPSWKQLVEDSTPVEEDIDRPTYGEPLDETGLAKLESELGVPLPSDLRSFLSECNGADDYQETIVFDANRMIEENAAIREEYADWDNVAPLEKIIAFSDAMGNGDLFALCVVPFESYQVSEVLLFDHETGHVSRYAKNLESHIRREED